MIRYFYQKIEIIFKNAFSTALQHQVFSVGLCGWVVSRKEVFMCSFLNLKYFAFELNCGNALLPECWHLQTTRFINSLWIFSPLNPELNPICYLLALLGAHHFLHVRRIRVKSLTLRLLMSYIYIYMYGAPILDVSRSHRTTQHSR